MTKQTMTRRMIVALTIALSLGLGSVPVFAEENGGRELVPYLAASGPTGAEKNVVATHAAAQSEVAEVLKTGKGIGGSSPMVIPAAAFSSKGNDAASAYFKIPSGYYQGTGLAGGCIQAPVYLPQGAEIVQIFASMYDNDPAGSVIVTLTRASNTVIHQAWDMATVATGSNSTAMQTAGDTSINYPIVDYPDYTYFVHTCLPAVATRLYSVRIYFLDAGIFQDGFETDSTSAWSSTVG